MERQLIFWPEAEDPCQEQIIWENLDPATQQTVINILSRLIAKAAGPKPPEQEVNHEH